MNALNVLLVQRVLKETEEILVHLVIKESRVQMDQRVLEGQLVRQEILDPTVNQETRYRNETKIIYLRREGT